MSAELTVRVFLVDDHEVVRQGVRSLLDASDDLTVVGEADSVETGLARVLAVQPDVAILDVRLPDGNGVELCREIRSRLPHVACLMLTSYSDDEALFEAIIAGAAGYVLKQVRGGELIDAVRRVARGEHLLDPAVTGRVMKRLSSPSPDDARLASLTAREREVLELIGQGMTNRQIGERMFLAEKTVKNYVSGLLAKMGMERRTEAAVFVARREATQSSDSAS
jgi:DNA-binding NarL/FixJ family response regulator